MSNLEFAKQQLDPGKALASGEGMTVVECLDGTRLSGVFKGFDPASGIVAVGAADNQQVREVPFESVKVVHLPMLPRFLKEKLLAKTSGQKTIHAADRQWFKVEFLDGKTLIDQTLGFSADNYGIYLLPANDLFQDLCVFIPYHAIKSYLLGSDGVCPASNGDNLVLATPTANAQGSDPLSGLKLDSCERLQAAFVQQRKMAPVRLGEALLQEGLLSKQHLAEALLKQQGQEQKQHLGEILLEQKRITMPDLQYALAVKLGYPSVDLVNFEIDAEAIKRVPEDMVRKFQIMPLCIFGDALAVVVENPIASEDALANLGFHTGLHIEAAIASRDDIARAIDVAYSMEDPDSLSLDDFRLAESSAGERTAEFEATDNVVVRLVNRLISSAYRKGASDIHIEPDADGAKAIVRIRKDGTLQTFYEIPALLRRAIPARIKVMAGLDIGERRKPQDGKINFRKFGNESIELRVATLPTVGGQEDVVLRILHGGKPLPLAALGLSERNTQRLLPLIEKPYGLIIVCGPTGSGKTTTLHSVLSLLNEPGRKIWTVEDPVEIVQKGLRQVQVHAKIGLDFASVMRSFLRADPDVIMLGEMRDRETTATGIEASLTGHLVLSTLHTNSAPESVVRLLEMGMDPFNFADALLGILAQRLTKLLCKSCKIRYEPSEEELQALVAEYCRELDEGSTAEQRQALHESLRAEWQQTFAGSDGRFTLYRASGCQQCNGTGYKGRVGIHEILLASAPIKKLIVETAPVAEILATAIKEGMRTLKQDGIEKVLQGMTDILQVRKVCIK